MGAICLAGGLSVAAVGTKVLQVNPATVHAPYWVLTAAGSVFAFAGIMIWGMGLQQHLAIRQQQNAARQYPDEIASQDYPWDRRSFTPSRWKAALNATGGLLFLVLFLSMFNWWAFFARGPLMVKCIVAFFDLILGAFAVHTVKTIVHACKFGRSRIEFEEFPLSPTKPVALRWKPASGIVRANKGTVSLRCVEEFFVTTGSGKNRSQRLVHEEIWCGVWRLDEPYTFLRSEEIELRFDLPPELPSTALSASRPIFWELEVKLDLSGLDFEERYLVPVYASTSSANSLSATH